MQVEFFERLLLYLNYQHIRLTGCFGLKKV